MTSMNDGDAIDRLLREDAARPLSDDGFRARVLRALPPPMPRFVTWKAMLILGSTALGCMLAFAFAPSDSSLFTGFADIATAHFATPAAIGAMGTAVALAVTGLVLASQED
ncbi:hypothetical protein [Usitatibacter palustris]|uniref:Uncharacterized protein n=1 Tax=Usitatibacter palustris TaxID=2732487 RepID=A0A6M4H9Y7_9PROT|nr:hypothetical protein [Usitatibacter palustris]QJR14867.1 hypothetical protein DSM104440_01682 [Usitatibacter palustris]